MPPMPIATTPSSNVVRGEVEHRRGRFRAPLASGVENPADRNGTARGFVRQRVEDRAQILLLPQDHAGGDGHFGIADALGGQPLEQAARDQGVIGRPAQLAVDPDVALDESGEVGIGERRAEFVVAQRRDRVPSASPARRRLPDADAVRPEPFL